MFCIWEHNGSEYRKKKHSFTLKISSHAFERMQKREVYKDAAIAIANAYASSKEVKRMVKGERIAIRSQKEGVIIILSLQNIHTYHDFLLCICTVWNMKNGDFYFRKGMEVYDFSFSPSGVEFNMAEEETILRQNKYFFE